MFCPNCGTQNTEGAATCVKCGFNLKGSSAPKFKGTMLMMNTPGAAGSPPRPTPPGGTPPPPAPPGPPPPAAPAQKPSFKGTMIVGGAPPPPAHPPYEPPQQQYQPPPAPPAQQPDFGPPQGAPPGFGAPQDSPPAFGSPQAAPPSPGFGQPADQPPPFGMGAPPMGGSPYGPPPEQPVNPLGGTYAAPPDAAPPPAGFPPPQGGPAPWGGAQPAPYAPPSPADGPMGGGFGGNVQLGAQQAMIPVGAPPMGAAMAQPGYGVPAGAGPKGQTRNPIMVLLLSMITCGLYGMYAFYSMLGELKAFLNSDEIQPWHLIVPVLNILLIFKLPGWVLEAKRRAGVPNPEVSNVILYWFLGLYLLPKDLNEVWNPTGQLTP